MTAAETRSSNDDRREFLKKMGTLPAAMAAAGSGVLASAKTVEEAPLPQIRLGPHSVSRLICGANPFNGGSHLSCFVNHQMREYYTPEQILKTLRRCQEVGINCWQSGGGNVELYQRLIDAGGKMHFISIEAEGSGSIERLQQAGCIGIPITAKLPTTFSRAAGSTRSTNFSRRFATPACKWAFPRTCPTWWIRSNRRAGTSTTT